MATTYTSALTTPAMSTTGTRKRTVGDTIRNLFPGNPFMALIETGLPNMDGVKQKKGLITKRKVDNTLFEVFTYATVAVTCKVTAWTNITNFTVSAVTGLRPTYCLLNTNNKTVCRVATANTSSLVVTATTIGSTAFTAAVDDELLIMGPAYAENSSSPYLLMKDEDNLYNTTQIFRFPAAVSNTAGGNPHYGGEYWGRIKERVVTEGLRKVSHSMFFSERASSGETTTDSLLSDTVRTMRGLWKWSEAGGASFDAGGNMTFDKFQNDLAIAMNDTVGQDTKKIMACGTRIWADILGWLRDGYGAVEPGSYNSFGITTKKLLTARGDVEILVLDIFDRGSLYKNALIFSPDEIEYVYKNKGPGDKSDRDFHPKLGIQANDVDGVEDEILGEVSVSVKDGGSTMTTVTNWLS